jgi:hypothetical protein
LKIRAIFAPKNVDFYPLPFKVVLGPSAARRSRKAAPDGFTVRARQQKLLLKQYFRSAVAPSRAPMPARRFIASVPRETK